MKIVRNYSQEEVDKIIRKCFRLGQGGYHQGEDEGIYKRLVNEYIINELKNSKKDKEKK